MPKCWSAEDRSSIFCLPYNRVAVGYNKLLFSERCVVLED